MQAISRRVMYFSRMTDSNLRRLRLAAGLTLRELARQIGEHPSNVSYWERTGHPPRSNVLAAIAEALGVSVDEVLGQSKTKRTTPIAGKARLAFESVSRLPRRQQEQIIKVVEALVAQNSGNQPA